MNELIYYVLLIGLISLIRSQDDVFPEASESEDKETEVYGEGPKNWALDKNELRRADKPADDKAAADKPAADKPADDKAAADKPAADKPDADKPDADKPDADKPDADTTNDTKGNDTDKQDSKPTLYPPMGKLVSHWFDTVLAYFPYFTIPRFHWYLVRKKKPQDKEDSDDNNNNSASASANETEPKS